MASVREFLDEWIPDSNREHVSAEIYRWIESAWDEGYQRGLRDAEQDVQHGADNPYARLNRGGWR